MDRGVTFAWKGLFGVDIVGGVEGSGMSDSDRECLRGDWEALCPASFGVRGDLTDRKEELIEGARDFDGGAVVACLSKGRILCGDGDGIYREAGAGSQREELRIA